MRIRVLKDEFSGSPEDIVAKMNATAMMPCDTTAEYVARWNQMAELVGWPTVNATSAGEFLDGLVEAGYAEIIGD